MSRVIARLTLFFFVFTLCGAFFLLILHKSYNGGSYSGQVNWQETDTDDLWNYYKSTLNLINPNDPESNPDVMTSTGSTFDANYYALIYGRNTWYRFRAFSRSLYQNDSYIIPGLRQTNVSGVATSHMVPQGICTAGDYILISAYSSSSKVWTSSVIYVLDKDTGKYLTTLALSTRCHVGALDYSTKTNRVYIADSSMKDERIPHTNLSSQGEQTGAKYRIWELSMRNLRKYINQNKDSVYVSLTKYVTCDTVPSFIFIHKNTLFVGSFNMDSFYPRSYATAYSLKTGKVISYKLYLSFLTQGAQIVEHNDGLYIITSSSYGRNNASYLHIHRIHYNSKLGWYLNPVEVRVVCIPNMSEDLDARADHLLINFESGANKYQNGNVTQYQMDRILNVSIDSLIEGYQMLVPYADASQAMENGFSTPDSGEDSITDTETMKGSENVYQEGAAAGTQTSDTRNTHIIENALIPINCCDRNSRFYIERCKA